MGGPILDTPDNWDLASGAYAESVAPRLMEPFAAEFIDALDAGDGDRVLEVACGSGAITTTLAGRVGSVLATDFSPKMLAELGRRLEARGITDVRREEHDGMALGLDDDSFDGAICAFGLMLFPDRAKGFSELRRVVRPGRRAVVAGWCTPDRFALFALFNQALATAFPDLPAPDAPPPVFSLANLDTFAEELRAAGFEAVETRFVTRAIELADVDVFWSMLSSGAPPVRLLLDRVGEAGVSKLRDVLNGQLRERFGDGPIRVENTATLGVGRVP